MLLGTLGMEDIAWAENIDGIGYRIEPWNIQNVDLRKTSRQGGPG